MDISSHPAPGPDSSQPPHNSVRLLGVEGVTDTDIDTAEEGELCAGHWNVD